MRLGFDLDGTVADLKNALALEAIRLFPGLDLSATGSTTPEPLDPSKLEDGAAEQAGGDKRSTTFAADGRPASLPETMSIRALSPRQQRRVWKEVCERENFWESLDEIEPGSLARLYQMVQERRWDLIFLTSRPDTRGDSVQTQTHRWLVSKGYETPSVFVVQSSRGKIAASLELDLVVDDRPENCLDVAVDSSARPILIWRSGQESIPASARQLGIGAVQSIGECLDLLDSLHKGEAGQGGLMERLKRLLRLKPGAAPSESSKVPLAQAESRASTSR